MIRLLPLSVIVVCLGCAGVQQPHNQASAVTAVERPQTPPGRRLAEMLDKNEPLQARVRVAAAGVFFSAQQKPIATGCIDVGEGVTIPSEQGRIVTSAIAACAERLLASHVAFGAEHGISVVADTEVDETQVSEVLQALRQPASAGGVDMFYEVTLHTPEVPLGWQPIHRMGWRAQQNEKTLSARQLEQLAAAYPGVKKPCRGEKGGPKKAQVLVAGWANGAFSAADAKAEWAAIANPRLCDSNDDRRAELLVFGAAGLKARLLVDDSTMWVSLDRVLDVDGDGVNELLVVDEERLSSGNASVSGRLYAMASASELGVVRDLGNLYVDLCGQGDGSLPSALLRRQLVGRDTSGHLGWKVQLLGSNDCESRTSPGWWQPQP